MHNLKDVKKKSREQESLVASLKGSITINPIKNVPNPIRFNSFRNKWDAMIPCNITTKEAKVSRKPYKGKLKKSSLKTIKQDIEKKEKELQSKREDKEFALDFIEKLNHIRKATDNGNILDETKEEIAVSSKQLEEIRKLFPKNIRNEMCSEPSQNNPKNVERKRSDQYHQHACKKRVNRQFQRLQEQHFNKLKVCYRSLKNFENFTSKFDGSEPVNPNNSEISINVENSRNNLTEKIFEINSIQCQTDNNPPPPQPEKVKKSVSFTNEAQEICYSEKSNTNIPRKTSSQILAKRKLAMLEAKWEDLDEDEPSLEVVTEQESSSTEEESCDEFNNIFFSNKFDKKTEPDTYTSKDNLSETLNDEVENFSKPDPREALLHGICTELDVMLKESVLKSDYLSKEFSPDFTNKFLKVDKEEKKSMQLLGTTQRKFQETRQLTNLKRRDQKLYTTLNIALKNTLYDEVGQ